MSNASHTRKVLATVPRGDAGATFCNPEAIKFGENGKFYSVILDDGGDVLLWAREATVESGVLCFWGGNRDKETGELPRDLLIAFPAGSWKYTYTSSALDEHPMAVDKWRKTSPYAE